MRPRSVIFTILSGLAFSAMLAVAHAQERPNILLFIGDDIDFSYYGFQGHEFVQTPHLDQLAAEGIVFGNGYATASVCRPALQSLLAGIRPYTWDRMADKIHELHPFAGYRRESRFVPFTLPRLLGQVGYASFAGGKMWEGTYDDAGFDAGTMDDPTVVFGVDGAEEFGRESLQELYDFIDGQTQPWFAWVAPMLPHGPYDPPQELSDLYAGRGLISVAERYFGNVTRMDLRLGEIRAFLDSRGLSDDTIIIYLGDNGWEQRHYDSGLIGSVIGEDKGKMSVHDRGFRTPIIVHWPAEVLAGQRTDRIVTFEDVFETILDYADAPSHSCTGGRSFRRVADDGRGAWRRRRVLLKMDQVRYPLAEVDASLQDNDPENDLPLLAPALGLYMRRGRKWAYSSVVDRDIEELYDLRRDPMGLDDLSDQRRGRLRGMRRRALKWNDQLEALRCPVAP